MDRETYQERVDRVSFAQSVASTQRCAEEQEQEADAPTAFQSLESPATTLTMPTTTMPKGSQDLNSSANSTKLRSGDVPDLYSRQHVGLLVQYAAIGLIYGALPRTVYPFLNNYLRMNGYQTLSARVLLALPWSLKVFIGIVSDCFPIRGSRRRAYMVLGWLLCCAMLLVLVATRQGAPFYIDRSLRGKDLSHVPRSVLQGKINWHAPARGATYVVLLMLASCGYMVADVASDGLVVEFAQREPEHARGHIQSTIYLVRSLAMIAAALLVGFGLNGVDYGGTFAWSLDMAQLLGICAALSLVAIPAALCCIEEPPADAATTLSLSAYLAQLWRLLQNGAMLQIMAYRFFSGIFEGFTITAGDPIQRYWAHVRPLNESLFSVLGLCVFSAALYATRRFGLHWDWRVVIATTLVSVLAVDATVTLLTVWDVVRNEWFWLGAPILEELPAAMSFLVSTFVVVEMAEVGNEAAVYGLLTTLSNLAAPFASCLSKQVNAQFDVSVDDIVRDTRHVRWHVTYTLLIAYSVKLLSLAWLVLLPRQKRETQLLKRHAEQHRVGGVMALVIGSFALLWSITTNLLSIFPSTACLVIAGGRGC